MKHKEVCSRFGAPLRRSVVRLVRLSSKLAGQTKAVADAVTDATGSLLGNLSSNILAGVGGAQVVWQGVPVFAASPPEVIVEV